MDKTVRPQDDFFNYVNGDWLKKTEIPSDRTRWGSFDELRQNTDKDALLILKEASKNPAYTSKTDQGKAVGLYRTILDTVTRNKQGVSPLKPYLTKIDKIKNVKELQALLIEMEPIGGLGFFGVGVGADAKNSNRNVVYLGVGSVGLPDRDYYLSEDADSKEKREKYTAHVARMLGFLGQNAAQAKSDAAKIMAFETALSAPRLDRVERRDDRKTYNPMTVSDLQKLMPSINWNTYLTGVGLKDIDSVIVSQPKYMVALEAMFKENKVDVWKAYMKWSLLRSSASQLSTDIEVANFDFYGKTLTGAIKQRPRDERALQVVNGATGEALGKLYVE
jgi:predicted metalloendopeptidase